MRPMISFTLLRGVSRHALALLAVSAAVAADAQEAPSSFPNLGGDIIFRLAYDGDYDAEGARVETDDLFFEMIASPRLDFGPRLSLNAEIRIEGIAPPQEDRTFDDQGAFVRKLFFTYDFTDDLTLLIGKITPSFALASFVTPGMYGNNYNKEIELIERLGLGLEYDFDGGRFGELTVSGTTFYDDTTFLSDSAINSRGQLELSDGGASNTESLESFTLSLEGNDVPSMPGFRYKIGLIHQAAGEGDADDEEGFALAAVQDLTLANGGMVSLIGEYAPIWNFEGSADDVTFTTLAAAYFNGPWLLALTGTSRYRDNAVGDDDDDYAIQIAAKYTIGNGYEIEVAHEWTRDRSDDGRTIGVRFIKNVDLGP